MVGKMAGDSDSIDTRDNIGNASKEILSNQALRDSAASISNSLRTIASTMNFNVESPAMQVLRDIAKEYASFYEELEKCISSIILAIPKIKISPETLSSLERLYYLSLYQRANWPVFLIDNEELHGFVKPFLEKESFDAEEFSRECIAYFDQYGINNVCKKWTQYKAIKEERLEFLKEAEQMYQMGYYASCVSICMCQLDGIISDTFKELIDKGITFDLKNADVIYNYYNPETKDNSRISRKIQKGDLENVKEKEQLICMLSDIDSAVFYWDAAINYLYRIVLTSEADMELSNHPCRNKICHGIQLNYGTKEHAIKALLSVDIALKLGEMKYTTHVVRRELERQCDKGINNR